MSHRTHPPSPSPCWKRRGRHQIQESHQKPRWDPKSKMATKWYRCNCTVQFLFEGHRTRCNLGPCFSSCSLCPAKRSKCSSHTTTNWRGAANFCVHHFFFWMRLSVFKCFGFCFFLQDRFKVTYDAFNSGGGFMGSGFACESSQMSCIFFATQPFGWSFDFNLVAVSYGTDSEVVQRKGLRNVDTSYARQVAFVGRTTDSITVSWENPTPPENYRDLQYWKIVARRFPLDRISKPYEFEEMVDKSATSGTISFGGNCAGCEFGLFVIPTDTCNQGLQLITEHLQVHTGKCGTDLSALVLVCPRHAWTVEITQQHARASVHFQGDIVSWCCGGTFQCLPRMYINTVNASFCAILQCRPNRWA